MRSWLSRLLVLAVIPGSVCRADLKWIDVDGVRVVEPPAEHPRLYLRARDLSDVASRMNNPVLRPVWDEMQAAAKESTQIRLEVAALRYLLDRDADRAWQTAAETLTLLRKVSGELGDALANNNSRKIGRVMVTGAIVYDWCHPLLTAEQKAGYREALVTLARALECGYPPDKGSFVTGHPSEWMILRDMLSAGVALYDEFPEMYRVTARRIFGSHLPARAWWYPGHAFHQGPGYADARWVSDMYALWIFDRMGAGNVFEPAQQFVPYEWIYLRRPDGAFIRSADGQNWPTRLGSLLTASYYGDGYILADYLKDPVADHKNPLYQFLWRDPGPRSPAVCDTRLFEFLWRDPALRPLPLDRLPLSRYFGFPYGWMVARTGWDEQSVIAQMRINIYNFVGHQHADAGSFELYYKGPLAMHTGVYQGVNGGFGGPHSRNYYQRTIAHNALLIHDPGEKFAVRAGQPSANDGGQRIPGGGREVRELDDMLKGTYRTGTVLGHGFGPDPRAPAYAYLKGDITAAYTSKVREVKRAFVFLNLGAAATVPAALVVFDRVVAANRAFAKTWLLHSIEEPSLRGATATVTLASHGWSGKLVNTTLLPGPDNLRLEKVGGPGKEFWVDGRNYFDTKDPPDPETGTWRVELSPRRPAEADLFLNVIQVMDAAAAAVQPLAVEPIETGGVVGMRLADRVVLFQSRAERTGEPVTFSVHGQVNLKFVVTDLAEGTWQVRWDGQIVVPAVVVSGDEGAAYFEGPAGDYELRR
jgi:heparin/heparan-sulfate lyase